MPGPSDRFDCCDGVDVTIYVEDERNSLTIVKGDEEGIVALE